VLIEKKNCLNEEARNYNHKPVEVTTGFSELTFIYPDDEEIIPDEERFIFPIDKVFSSGYPI
jgi:hypothetical protein